MLSQSINESKFPVHVIQNEEINSSKSLGDNLKGLSGVNNADYGAAVGQPSIRGLTGNRTKILSNNIAVNDLSSLSADHINNVDLNNISHIEVLRGPSSIFTHGGTRRDGIHTDPVVAHFAGQRSGDADNGGL